MDKAKAAVSDFLHKSGRNDTTVHENVAPAVQHETVNQKKHEDVTTAIDREVHQDHYHTSVQPIQDREVLPEQHHHNLVGVEHRKHDHDDPSKTKEFLERERAKFTNTTTKGHTEHTQSAGAVVAGEHTHHHVHENIQPVIEKETIQPHVVHTTVPVHEVHNNAAQHHNTSTLPAMTMQDFTSKGGELSGRGERYDAFDGAPKAIGGLAGGHHTHGHDSTGTTGTTGATSGLTGSSATRTAEHDLTGKHHKTDSAVDGYSNRDNTTGGLGNTSSGLGNTSSGLGNTSSGLGNTSSGLGNTSSGLGNTTGGVGGTSQGLGNTSSHNTTGTSHGLGNTSSHNTTGTTTGTKTGTTTGKPSLMDKLNPMVDSNGDGKAGFMK